MALGQLINGEWVKNWSEQDDSGRFQRMPTLFHSTISSDREAKFSAIPNRYHLYISLGCPWAHRTALVWKLKGLENIISLSIVDPVISEEGWKFSNAPGCIPDTINNTQFLREIYTKAAPTYTGRVTVPVIWDRKLQTIVNNESLQIIKFLNSAFDQYADNPDLDLYPEKQQAEIDQVIEEIYHPINNGVYRTGFASTQAAYEEAVHSLFEHLERWEHKLCQQRYVCGDQITLADWCLFTTLFRFDLAYYGIFKCNLKPLRDFPSLWAYCRDLYQIPGVSEVSNPSHVKQLYYAGIPEVNPNGIIPAGPKINFEAPHYRADQFSTETVLSFSSLAAV